MKRIMSAIAALVAAVCIVPALSGCSGQAPAGTLTIGLTYVPNVQFAPFYIAAEKGYFEQAALHVTLRHHSTNEQLFSAANQGREDLVYAGGDEAAQADGEGSKLTSVAQFYHEYPVALFATKDSGITDAASLRGRKIGVPGKYGETWFGLLSILKDAGLTEKDVTVQPIGYTQQSALQTGKVDAVMGYTNGDGVQFQQAGIDTVTIAAGGSETRLIGPSLIATDAALKKKEAPIRKALAALARGAEYMRAHPKDAVNISKKYVTNLDDPAAEKNALATVEASAKLYKTAGDRVDLANDSAAWGRMLAFLPEAGIAKKLPAGQKAYTNECVSTE